MILFHFFQQDNRVMRRKHRRALTITQSNDCRCFGSNRSKQQSRYNKTAKRQSSRLARKLDRFAILEQLGVCFRSNWVR